MTPPAIFTRGAARRRAASADQNHDAPASGESTEHPAAANGTPRPRGERQAPSRERALAVSAAADAWRSQLVELGGTSPLADITLLGDAVIDLTAAHPSGIAQLYAGRTTRLTNLVREGAALVAARRSARIVRARADELAHRYGIAPTYLTVGVATWTMLPEGAPGPVGDGERDPMTDPASTDVAGSDHHEEQVDGSSRPEGADPRPVRTVHAPVVMRPVRLAAHAGPEPDFHLDLEPAVEINPVLVRALRDHGADVDVAELARACFIPHGFSPRAALADLAELGREHLPGFEMSQQIKLGPFLHPGQVLVEDLDAMRPHLAGSDVVAALAGDGDARAALRRPLPDLVPEDRAPEAERGAGDLDVDQQHAVDAATSGVDLFLDAPPGADAPATVAAIIADAAASGRRVLYVPGTRRVGRALLQRLEDLGLSDLTLDLSTDAQWRSSAAERIRSGLAAPHVEVDDDGVRAMRAELTGTRAGLGDYVAALHAVRDPWAVSAHDALEALAELTAEQPAPRTPVRFDDHTLRGLLGDGLVSAREKLARAAELGAFTLSRQDTPWYGARLSTAAEASDALERTQRLAEVSLPELRHQVDQVVEQTGLRPATTLGEWSEQLQMLDGVRAALDVFTPMVFERSVDDMVTATAGRAWRKERSLTMPASVRRRLRKQAQDLLRPGRPVDDLHAELVRVQEQREIWRRHCQAGGWPRLPAGLAEIEQTERRVRADIEVVQEAVGAGAGNEDLLALPLDDLIEQMRRLGQDPGALRVLPERTRILGELADAGLRALLEDLRERRVPTPLVGAELDLAWWTSVLEQVLAGVPTLAGMDGPALNALAQRFRELDAEQVASLSGPVRRAVADAVRAVVDAHPEEAARLADALDADQGGHLRETLAAHPAVAGAVRPVRLVAPILVPQLLGPEPDVDLLVLDGVQNLPVAQALAALARAHQVVLVGDSRRGGDGVVAALGPLLPTITLPTGRGERAEGIAAFLSRHGYSDVIRSVPAPSGESRMHLDLVEGYGMPAPGADMVESVQQEVDRVVRLVLTYARRRPTESLAVVALGARHAQRVREAVLAAAADDPSVAAFFAPDRPEPFTVVEVDAASGLRRDTIVLTVGYGKTPHGRVLHHFGPVSGPDGVACLVDALDAVRHQLVVVSCIGPGDIDRERLRDSGPLLLADLIDAAAQGGTPTEQDAGATEAPDRLLADLAARLRRLGLTVAPRYGAPGGVRVPLAVGHPDAPGELVVAVLTDDADYVAEPSLRRRDRHWVQRLADRGWVVHMAFSTAVFMDPDGEATEIARKVRAGLAGRGTDRAQQERSR